MTDKIFDSKFSNYCIERLITYINQIPNSKTYDLKISSMVTKRILNYSMKVTLLHLVIKLQGSISWSPNIAKCFCIQNKANG